MTPHAARQLKKLPPALRARLEKSFLRLTENPRHPGCEKLEGESAAYRVRVGDYRIRYEIQDQVLVVLVLNVAHRRHVYDR